MVLPISNPTKSFWIEAADSKLRNRRTTPELPKECDVVIVGSGYTGASAAYWIHRYTENSQTPSMVMLEARDICGAATGRNGGQLRPHLYSRYPAWSQRFGAEGALALIQHENAHFRAFADLMDREGIAEETSFKLGETYDAAMSEEAWTRLKGAFHAMQKDHGVDGDIIKDCYLIEDPKKAEEFTKMKGCIGAVVHPSGQVWPYKFVHALLRIVEKTGHLNIQADTPVEKVSERDGSGWITVDTPRGRVRAKTVLHATNRWASHLLPEFQNLIYPGRGTLAAIKAPEGQLPHTGAQHWDSIINNYFLQLPPPHNTIIIGGAKSITVKNPESYVNNDREDVQFDGVPDFYKKWPKNDVNNWKGEDAAPLELDDEKGGVWTGVYSSSVDSFPFVGALPGHKAHFIAAGFSGHGMPRILLSTAHVAGQMLQTLGVAHTLPDEVTTYPPLPGPFHATAERIQRLQSRDALAQFDAEIKMGLESSKKSFAVPDSLGEVAVPAHA